MDDRAPGLQEELLRQYANERGKTIEWEGVTYEPDITGADRITNALETSQFEGAFDPKTREAVVSIFELGAKMAGKDLDTFLDDNFSVQIFDRVPDNSPSFQGKKGGTRFIEAGKALINTTNWSDLSTIAHEVQHVVQLNLPEQYRAEYSKVFGIDKTAFDKPIASLTAQEREGFEKAARAFEEYLYTGEAPTAKLKTLFDQIKDFIRRIYTAVRGDLTPDAQALFDRMLGAGEAELLNAKKRETALHKEAATRGKLAAAAVLYQNGEYEQVYNRYHDAAGNPLDGWMKAPNGKPTNLTEKQWLQVRTPAFKKWFGDWEIEAQAKWLLEASPVTTITGNEFEKSDIDLVTQVSEFFKSIGGQVNREGFGTVILDKEGAKSSIAHGIGSKKAAAFAAVPDIIKNGIVIDHQQNWKGRGNETYVIAAPLKMGKDDYIGEVVLTKREGDAKFYLHEVEIRGKLSDVLQDRPSPGSMDNSPDQATNAQGTGIAHGSRLIIAKKLAEVKGQVSKVVDENGEPLVVYHATDNDFDVFDAGRGGENTRYNVEDGSPAIEMSKIGHWFAKNNLSADMFTEKAMALFLNIKNPSHKSFDALWTQAAETSGEDMRRLFQTEDYDGLIINDTEFNTTSYVAFSPTQIKSAEDNAGTFDADNPSILYQSIGELGAQALDEAEDATTRLDNLAAAKAMEKAGKDAKAVRLATGWERGADGKWRYEIPDLNMRPEWNKALAEAARSQETLTLKLGDIADAPALFDAYPQLKNTIVYLSPYRAGAGNGSYQDGFITVSGSAFGSQSVLAHEVQHAIQDIEGFAEGGSPEGMADRAASEGDIASWWNDEGGANEATPYFILTEEEKQAANERYLEEYAESTGRDEYHRLAGEVEARNTQSRLRMTPEERQKTLLAETEDVAREDQIIIENALDRASIVMASRGDPLWFGTEQEMLDYASGFDTYEAMLEDAGVKPADLAPDEKALFERIYHTVHPVEMGVDLDADGIPDWVTKPLDEVLTRENTEAVSG